MSSLNELHTKLEKFSFKYYRNKLIRGILLLLLFLVSSYLLIVVGEYFAYFSKTVRLVIDLTFVSIALLIFFKLILKPILWLIKITKPLSLSKIDKILRKHFPELKDQLKNILELEKLSNHQYSAELIQAAIEQKSANIKVIPFNNAVKIKENFKYIKYLSLPIIIIVVLIIASPDVLSEGTERLINYDKQYKKPLAFWFDVADEQLIVSRGEDLNLKIKCDGAYIPNPVKIKYGGVEYFLPQTEVQLFEYEFPRVQQGFLFSILADQETFGPFEVKVLPNPQIIGFKINITPPKYTNLQKEIIENSGDIVVPEGSLVEWQFVTKDIRKLWLSSNDSSFVSNLNSDNNYSVSIHLLKDLPYSINASVDTILKSQMVQFKAQVIPDEYPQIVVKSIEDTLHMGHYYFYGQTADDYGISQLTFNYQFEDQIVKKTPIPLSSRQSVQEFYYAYNLIDLIEQGQSINFYFEVWDNDAVNGSKSSKSQTYRFYLPNKEEISEMEQQQAEEIQNKVDESKTLADELRKDLKDLKESLINSEMSEWQATQKLSEISEKHNELQKLMEQAAKENEKNNELIKNLTKEQKELVEKQEQIEEMLSQLMDEEMKELMEEINKLMKDFDKDQFNELSEKLDMSYEDLSEQLDRNLEQLKKLELEKRLEKTVDDLQKLAEEHQQLSDETKEKKSDSENLKQQQAEHQKKLDNIEKDLNESMKKNESLENPMPIEEFKEKMDSLQKQMQNSKQSLENQQNKKASKQQKGAAQQMQEMAQQMSQMMQEQSLQQQSQDIEALKQILENLNDFSFQQEAIMLNFRNIKYKDPKYMYLYNQQIKNAENFEIIKDSLYNLAKSEPMIAAPINKELLKIDEQLTQAQEQINERKVGQAQVSQQLVMTSANNLSLLLSEIMDQMKKQMQSQCSKPGSCSKPSGTPKPGFGQPKQQAQSLKQQMQKMLDQLKDGKGQQNGQKINQGLGKMIAEHDKMQQMLQELSNSQGLSPQTAKELKEIKKLSEDIENELIQKNITPELLKRQELILTRLLEAENSEFKREQDKKRESKPNINDQLSNPEEIFKYKDNIVISDDLMIKTKLKLRYFYQEKYKNYILNINE
ncbi:MAG: hypothetical protein JXR60_12360 [Bacteroidales bacterium]|nr:hypothetical protein [Bacteroidales bacterium]